MSNCIRTINGVEYVPVRAIPYLTANHITPKGVIDLMSCRNPHFSGRSYKEESGSLIEISPAEWALLDSEIPAEPLVARHELNQIWFDHFIWPSCDPTSREQSDAYHQLSQLPALGDLLSEEDIDYILEGACPNGKQQKSRKNCKQAVQQRIEAAVCKIEAICKAQGISLDRTAIPGLKRSFFTLLKTIDPSISMAESTFSDHAKEMGLRWKQGGKQNDSVELEDAVRASLRQNSN
jgi:hypothetical protein